VILEYIPGTNLGNFIEKVFESKANIDNEESRVFISKAIVSMMRQISETIYNINRAKIIHNDLKPANIMVKPDGDIVIVDFGTSCTYDTSEENLPFVKLHLDLLQHEIEIYIPRCKGQQGTLLYCAPELMRTQLSETNAKNDSFEAKLFEANGKPVDQSLYDYSRVDTYSMAKIFIEMATGVFLCNFKYSEALERGDIFEKYPNLSLGNDEMQALILDMGKDDCYSRLTSSATFERIMKINFDNTLPITGAIKPLVSQPKRR
jgi:serine/threonine protein kinase